MPALSVSLILLSSPTTPWRSTLPPTRSSSSLSSRWVCSERRFFFVFSRNFRSCFQAILTLVFYPCISFPRISRIIVRLSFILISHMFIFHKRGYLLRDMKTWRGLASGWQRLRDHCRSQHWARGNYHPHGELNRFHPCIFPCHRINYCRLLESLNASLYARPRSWRCFRLSCRRSTLEATTLCTSRIRLAHSGPLVRYILLHFFASVEAFAQDCTVCMNLSVRMPHEFFMFCSL